MSWFCRDNNNNNNNNELHEMEYKKWTEKPGKL